MWAIDDVAGAISAAGSWCINAGSGAFQVPLIGPYIGGPLQSAGSYLQNAASSLGSFSGWVDSVASQAQQAYGEAQQAWDYAVGTVWSLAASAQQQAQAAYAYATGYLTSLALAAQQQAQAAYAYATGYLTQLAISALQQANLSWSYVSNVSGGLAQAVWGWIQSGALQAYMQSWWASISQQLIGLVTAQLGYLITQGFTLLQNSWSSFEGSFVWLLDQIIAMVGRQASHFSGSLWALLEILLDSIERPGG